MAAKAIRHTESTYSSGIEKLDAVSGGGFRKGSIALLEFGTDTDPCHTREHSIQFVVISF